MPDLREAVEAMLAERFGIGRNPQPRARIHKKSTHRPQPIHRDNRTDDPQPADGTVDIIKARRDVLLDALGDGPEEAA